MHKLDSFDKVLVSLSGGIDSAALLYMVAKQYTITHRTTEVYAITGYGKPDTLEAAKFVWGYVKNKFGNINWKTHFDYDNYYDKSYYSHRGKADHEHRSIFMEEHNIKNVLHGRVRTNLTEQQLKQCERQYPQAVAKLLLNSHVIETKKTYMPQNRWEYTIHRPISYYTKSMIIDYIKEHNADELLTETISCYKQKKEPCKQCPSCLEKMDLLGHY